MPYIAQVALKKKDSLSIYGGDYATPDGTGITVQKKINITRWLIAVGYFFFFITIFYNIFLKIQK